MKVEPHPRDIVRAIVIGDHSPFEASVEIVREKHAGKDAAFAVTFEDRKGRQRQGVLGLRKQPGGTWRPSGSFMGTAHLPGERDVAKEPSTAAGWPIRPRWPPEPPTR